MGKGGRSFLACLAILGGASCGREVQGAQPEQRQHVIVLTVEGLRSDVLAAYRPWFGDLIDGDGPSHGLARTPNLDALAASSLLYSYAVAPSAWCPPSLAALWASEYPSRLDFTDLAEPLTPDAVCLAELLQRKGWETHALVEHPFLGVNVNLDQGFATYGQVPGERSDERAQNIVEEAKERIRDLGSKPTLLWVQLGGLGPPFDPASGEPGLSRSDWLRYRDDWTDGDLDSLYQMYCQEVERLDGEIGELLRELQGESLDERTVVVLAGTNGCELLEHGLIGDAASLGAALTRVPLMIHIPGQLAGVIEEPVSLIDVAPSLLRLVGLSAPDRWAGISILPGEPIPTRDLYSELHRGTLQRASVRGDWKLLWDGPSDSSRLFDIYSDPWEANDLSRQQGAVHMDMLRDLRTFAGESEPDESTR